MENKIQFDPQLLQNVKLKTVADEDKQRPVVESTQESKYEDDDSTREYFFQSGIDMWYEHLKEFTFPSVSVDLSREEAQWIVHHWERKDKEQSELSDIPDVLSNVAHNIQSTMNQINSESASNKSFFVKLSTRSPKDSNTAFKKAAEQYKKRVDELGNPDANKRWILLTEEMGKATSVTNALEALALLLDSERVYEDLKFALEDSSNWNISIIIRIWDERVTLQSEFRGFCWNGELNCLGQYYHPLYFEELQSPEVQAQIIHDCCGLFNILKQKHNLPVPNALVDFAWLGPGNVMLIEINPLSETLGCFPASTGLFDWHADR